MDLSSSVKTPRVVCKFLMALFTSLFLPFFSGNDVVIKKTTH